MRSQPFELPPILRRAIALIALLAASLAIGAPTAVREHEQARRGADWLDQHPTLTLGTSREGRYPLEELRPDGQLVGISADLLRAIIGKRQVTIKTRQYPSLERLLHAVCNGEVDLVANLVPSAERERCMVFSDTYLYDGAVLLARSDATALQDPDRLAHARVGIYRNSTYEKTFRQRYPEATVLPLTFGEINHALLSGRVDVYLGTSSVAEHLRKQAPAGSLTILRTLAGTGASLSFAAPKQNRSLIAALDAGLARIPDAQRRSIMAKWLGNHGEPLDPPHEASDFDLSPSERAYLKSLPPLKLGYALDWEPLSYADKNGHPAGVLNSYVEYLSRTLGLRFERQPIDAWPHIVSAATQGRLDIVAGVSSDDDHFREMLVSRPVDSYPLVLVQQQYRPSFTSLTDLVGRRIAAVNGEVGDQPALRLLPGARIINARNMSDALQMLMDGQVEGVAANLAVVDTLIQREYIGKLKVGLALKETQGLSFATAPQYAALAPLIDRALRAIPETEVRRIRSKWLNTQFEFGVKWSDVLWRLLPVALICLIAISGLLYAYIVSRREVAARRRAEDALASQLALLKTVMQSVPYPLVINDRDGNRLSENRAFEQMFLAPPNSPESGGANPASPVNVFRATLKAATAGVLSSGRRVETELAYRDGNGDNRMGLFSTEPILAEPGGQSAGTVSMLVDLTESRRAQASVAASERLLRELTANLPAVVFQAKMTPDGMLSFPFVSGNAPELFGISADSLMEDERNAFNRILPSDRDNLIRELERSAATLTPARPLFRVDNGKRTLWLQGQAMPNRDTNGNIIWNGYWSDTSREHDREQTLKNARDAAQAASRAKDEFLAMMSHEIRTPMNGVMGLVEVLQDTQLNPDQTSLVDMVSDSARTMLTILDDILDFSKIEAGHLTLENTDVDLRILCGQTMGLLASRARDKGLLLYLLIDSAIAARHRTDNVRLRQVLFNLLSNAIKFTERGAVTLSLRLLTDDAGEQRLDIEVLDTGVGIAANKLPQLFDPFVQADTSISRRFGGTGLGLSICQRLVSKMQGEIALASVEGEGTTASVSLPLPVVDRYPKPLPLTGKTIGVDVQDAILREALTQYLVTLGTTVSLEGDVEFVFHDDASDGQLALAKRDAQGKLAVLQFLQCSPLTWEHLAQSCFLALMPGADWPAGFVPPHRQPLIAGVPTKRMQRILVAEDHPVNRQVALRHLTKLGFDCDLVTNGDEALEAIKHGDYALLLTDCHMPKLDGYSLTVCVREWERRYNDDRHLPIVGITASTRADDIGNAAQAGMDDCLIKPVSLAALSECLNRFLPLSADELSAAAIAQPETAKCHPESASPSPQFHDEGPLQPAHLLTLRRQMGNDLPMMMKIFRDSLAEDLTEFPPDHDDAEAELADWLHRNKGSAIAMSFDFLADAITAVQRLDRHQARQEHGDARTALLQLGEATVSQIDAWLAAQPSH